MTTTELLTHLHKLNVTLTVENGQLIFNGPKGTLTAALRAQLGERKAELVAALKNGANGMATTPSTLRPLPRDKEIPLSFAQQRLWFLDQLEPGSVVYNIAGAFRIAGILDLGVLQQSLEEIVRRHETLRTTFSALAGEPVQVIAPALSLSVPVLDISGFSGLQREKEAAQLAVEEVNKPFDLRDGPLFRATLLRLDAADHVLLVTLHHIVSDGWSMGVLWRELSALYEAFANSEPSPLADLPIQYADYAAWQRQWLQGNVLEAQLSYWKKQLDGAPAALNLPTDRPRPPMQSFRGARQSLEFSGELTRELKALSRKEGTTLYMTLLAAFQTLLHRYTGQNDIVVGSPIANRNRIEIEGLIGFFVNTLALRTDFSDNLTFRSLLRRVRETALEAYAHQDLPFEKLVEELRPDRDLSRSPLFQAMFVFQNTPGTKLNFQNLEVSPLKIAGETAKFDLTLSMQEQAGQLSGALQYNTDLFDASTIERMVGHFLTLVKGIVTNPDRPITRLPLLSQAEERRLLIEWNNTGSEYPKNQCIPQMFEAQVEKIPEAPAVIFENQQLTYRELNARANQLAHCLVKLGVGPELPVGICVDRSVEMIVSLLAVLKAGGVYVPLDPAYPRERLEFMIDDAQIRVLLTQQRQLSFISHRNVVCLDRDGPKIASENTANLPVNTHADNLVYVIYTSGSTGKPKGVAVSHSSIADHCLDVQVHYGLTRDDRVLQFASTNFDASLEQILPTLITGARLVLRGPEVWNHREFRRIITKFELTVINLPTAYWHQIAQASAMDSDPATSHRLRLVIVGGEAMAPGALKLWRDTPFGRARLLNAYGPTESTITATAFEVPADYSADIAARMIPIGRPLGNRATYILDEFGNLAPIGVAGELHIGGMGLARGYLNRPELTAEKFIVNPFSADPGSRLYKTGDLARYLPDGNIEFLGRIDKQVKVRGFRIELGEIEAVLARHAGVREALVLAREDGSQRQLGADRRLIAYVVAGKTAPAVNELRAFVQKTLPDYMVPSAFVFLTALPLTANGKVDRNALPAPERPAGGDSFRNPRSPTEIALADIWAEVLEVSQVGLDDNFFDLGGHSLLAARLMARIKNEIGAELPLRVLFESPTITELAPKIHSKKQQSIFHQREQGKYAHLFELQAGDKRNPIFCFPFRGGLDGEFFNFIRVARLFDSQHAFYGVLARGLDGFSEPRHSIQEMAADYLKEIRSVQPHGPYIFVGECQGGFVAYEAARQMMANGGEMGLLVLLDSHAGLPVRGPWRRWAVPIRYRLGRSPALKYLRNRYDYHLHAIRRRSPAAAVGYSLGKMTRVFSTIPYLLDLEQSETPTIAVSEKDKVRFRLERLRQAFDVAIRRYVLKGYLGRVALLLNERAYDASRFQDWAGYIGENFEVYKLPGDHDICVPQNIPLVAQILKDCLAAAEKKS